jgi:hypothetical protein
MPTQPILSPGPVAPGGGYFSGPGTDPGFYEPPRPRVPPALGPPMPREPVEPIGQPGVGRVQPPGLPARRPIMGGPGFQPEPEPIPIFNFPQPPRGGLPPVRQPVMGGPGYQPGRVPTRSPIDEMGLWELAMRRMQQYY